MILESLWRKGLMCFTCFQKGLEYHKGLQANSTILVLSLHIYRYIAILEYMYILKTWSTVYKNVISPSDFVGCLLHFNSDSISVSNKSCWIKIFANPSIKPIETKYVKVFLLFNSNRTGNEISKTTKSFCYRI